MELAGKHFLVTGASGALGSRITARLVDAGATVTISGRSADALSALGVDGAHVVAADLAHPGAPEDLVVQATSHVGHLDGVVIASGIVAFGPAAEVDDDTVDDLLLVDLLAPLRLVRSALTRVEAGGVILSISGVIAEKPVGGMAAYCAAKAGISAFVEAVRPEARRRKVRVVDARPPHTETGLATRAISGTAPSMPAGLDPDDVAARIVSAIVDDEKELPSSAFS
ncbi:short-chain dehydrogenase [Rhodococcus sp. Leaf7]|uniref:SDR family NAD(P)-dependent oxidoreductase n=1 Tax=unclassified Rhodococcus (in: high G+C Gram-positive bacteria) TaxID=192944 RepID=UPI0006F493FC|nr:MULTISPECIES: SDR family NAD(P)-dependent oxidoreductase [unclassified Rhodococcus (in: high G+C Gram-positive bacteria)]KQU03111.1 short-chain dehydrogenase [Rhodococcus sp. Leaf7]KQU38912.1 short-chain dehydrogenase [Rhodococcus sp. Leaf247]